MKLSQFSGDINKNIMQGKIIPTTTLESAGGNTAGLTTLGKAAGAVSDMLGKVWLKDQNDKIFDAKNDYEQRINSLMDDENTGLFNTHQGKAAENLQKDYTDQEQKIYQQVLQDHGISSDYAVRAFGEQRAQSQTSNLRMIDKYQRKQMEDYAGNQISLMTSNMVNQSVKDPDSLITNFGSWEKNTTAILAGLSMDSAAIDVKMKALKNDKAKEIMQSYLTTGDYSAGLNAIAYMKSQGIDEPTLKAYKDPVPSEENDAGNQKQRRRLCQRKRAEPHYHDMGTVPGCMEERPPRADLSRERQRHGKSDRGICQKQLHRRRSVDGKRHQRSHHPVRFLDR